MRAASLSAVLLLCLTGCTVGHARQSDTAEAAPAAPSNELPIKEFMYHVVQYTAEGVWSRQGWITDEKGERSLFPATDEEWEKAESAALSLAELMTLLELPARKVDDGQWARSARDVRKVALEAADAALKKDETAFFDAGGRLDVACESCHVAYIPDYVGPGAEAAKAAD